MDKTTQSMQPDHFTDEERYMIKMGFMRHPDMCSEPGCPYWVPTNSPIRECATHDKLWQVAASIQDAGRRALEG